MSVIKHVLGTLVKTILSFLVALVLGGALGAGITLAVAYNQLSQPWPPQGLTLVAAIVIGVLSALLSAGVVLMHAAVRGLLKTGKLALKEATGPVGIAVDAFKIAEHLEGH